MFEKILANIIYMDNSNEIILTPLQESKMIENIKQKNCLNHYHNKLNNNAEFIQK